MDFVNYVEQNLVKGRKYEMTTYKYNLHERKKWPKINESCKKTNDIFVDIT